LNLHILDSSFSLPEARILYEIGQNQPCTASHIMAVLRMDRGYMSRLLSLFEQRGHIVRKKSKEDGRVYHLILTAKGKKAFANINHASNLQVVTLLRPLSEMTREKLLEHMNSIRQILESGQLQSNGNDNT
jgi:DNA-binding MarR family transcriptional regulator